MSLGGQHEGQEHSPDAAITVTEGVDRLEMRVRQGKADRRGERDRPVCRLLEPVNMILNEARYQRGRWRVEG
jgi:hypothetical protein